MKRDANAHAPSPARRNPRGNEGSGSWEPGAGEPGLERTTPTLPEFYAPSYGPYGSFISRPSMRRRRLARLRAALRSLRVRLEKVPGVGLEPTLHFWNQILSLCQR